MRSGRCETGGRVCARVSGCGGRPSQRVLVGNQVKRSPIPSRRSPTVSFLFRIAEATKENDSRSDGA